MGTAARVVLRWLALVTMLIFAASGTAIAHAVVLETQPADGALVETKPAAVSIIFNEPVRPIRFQVLNAAGLDVTPPDAATLDGSTFSIALPAVMEPGSYLVSYRVVSIDSHPIAGTIVFSLGQVSSSIATPVDETDDAGWRIVMAAVRALLFAGILGGAGGVLFIAFVLRNGVEAENRVRAAVSNLAAAGAGAALVAMGVQGGLLVNGPAASFASAEVWRIGAGSLYGKTALAALVGLMLVAIGVRASSGSRLRTAASLGTALALISFGLSGHVATSEPGWATVPSLLAHTFAAAFWAGSLVPLGLVIASRDAAASAVIARFSRLAVIAVGVLVVAGMIMAILQVRSPAAMVTTGYGIALSLKLCLVAGLIGLAAVNKLLLTPAFERGASAGRSGLRLTIGAEMVLVAGVLVATATMGTRTPPRALALGAAHAAHLGTGEDPGLVLTIMRDDRSADIELTSLWSGINNVEITLREQNGTVLDAREVLLAASNPGDGVEPILRTAERTADGTWRIANILLAPAGRWTLRVDALISDFEKLTFETRTDLLNRQPAPAS